MYFSDILHPRALQSRSKFETSFLQFDTLVLHGNPFVTATKDIHGSLSDESSFAVNIGSRISFLICGPTKIHSFILFVLSRGNMLCIYLRPSPFGFSDLVNFFNNLKCKSGRKIFLKLTSGIFDILFKTETQLFRCGQFS